MQFAGALLVVTGSIVARSAASNAWAAAGGGVFAMACSALLVRWRWGNLSRYIAYAGARPRGWNADAAASDSFLAWQAVRPVLESWMSLRRGPWLRILGSGAQRPGAPTTHGRLGTVGQSGASFARELSSLQVSDYCARTDELTSRLDDAERAALRASGELPTWFWAALASGRPVRQAS